MGSEGIWRQISLKFANRSSRPLNFGILFMENVIARRELIFRKGDGDELVTEIQIGAPYKMGEWEWACDIEVPGICERTPVHGVDSFQSLILGLNVLKTILERFEKEHGTILFPDDKEPINVEEIFARGLIREHDES